MIGGHRLGMYIPEEKVEEVRAATDVVEVVGDYVRLKKRGSNWVGLCPFHNEKTPSFNVNPGMGIFKCFGCGEGGNVYQFLMKVEGLPFPEVVRTLAERAGIPLPEEGVPDEAADEKESILHALRFAARWFYERLTATDEGRGALEYLTGRGLTPKTIKRFGLGYAPDRWDGLLTAAQEAQIKPEALEGAGLVIPRKKGEGHYDRYRGRVIFPILSHVGKVLGFGGRILAAADDQPKYINSPETKVYNKSRVLYGLHQGKQAARRKEEVVLVEGYTDVISLHQAGVEHAVASSGTALTEEQVKLIGRYAKRVLLLYDADAAGATAAVRGIDLVLAQGLAAYAVALPAGEDPDSFVRAHGGKAFEDYLHKHRQDFVAFKHELARRAGHLDTPEGAAEAMRSVVASIARVADPIAQETYLRRANEVLNIRLATLHEALQEEAGGQQRRQRRPPPAPPPPDDDASRPAEGAAPDQGARGSEPLPEEKALLRLMLEHGTPMVELVLGNMSLEEFTAGPSRAIASHLIAAYEQGEVRKGPFLEGVYSPAVQSLAAEVLMDQHEVSRNWERINIPVPRLNEDPYRVAQEAMRNLKLDRLQEAIDVQTERVRQANRAGDEAAVRALQEGMMHLHALRKEINTMAFA